MKINFRKISAIAASALMAGMTLGVAAAANYPAPFVSGGVPNVAVVWGTGTGVSSLDQVQAGNIQNSLGDYVTGGSVVVEGGEPFALTKTSDHFNFAEALNGVYTDLDDNEMEDFLADGTYDDGDVDEDYSQKITLSAKTLSLIADNDLNDKEPTIGFTWSNGDNVLDYDITFDDGIPFEDLEDTDLPLMGKMYYVLDVPIANTSIVLLDSADKVIINEGETKTVGDKTVSIEYIEDGAVKFNVDGEITETLNDHEYDELADGSYIVANDIMFASKEVGISKVEFSIGAGKLTLKTGEDVEVNDEDFEGIVATIGGQGTSEITGINIAWDSDDESFLTEDHALVMPLFETISLVFGGLDFPDDPETISFTNGEQMTLEMDNYDLELFHWAGTDGVTSTLGEEDYALVTAVTNLAANYTAGSQNTTDTTGGLDLVEDNRFIVTTLDPDLGDIDVMYYEVTNIDWTHSGSVVDIQLKDLIGDNDLTFDSLTDEEEEGSIKMNITQMNDTRVYFKFYATSGTLGYNKVVSEKGLVITLPAKTASGTNDLATGVDLTLREADYEGDVEEGRPFTITVKDNADDNLHVSTHNLTAYDEEASSDVFVGWVPSDLASKIDFDTSGDDYDFELTYYGAEVTADVQVVGGASTISSGTNTLGNVVILDTEVGNFATKNLIVVGGSCINLAAAALVGGAHCGAAWTSATGIGSGQFLIKGYADSKITSELALLVAGYDVEDTVKATTYLTNKVVDTSKAYKGTTTTETAVVID